MTRDLDALSDLELIVRAREGDTTAYGVLWKRHWHAARAMAASITGRFEPDDLASEAFARILQAVEKGNGPRSGFRSYLAITIRNVAIDWSRRKTTPNIEDPDTIEDWTYSEVTALKSIDRQLLAQAFYTLPDSWQEVLWYTEVEDMAPREVAPILGLTPNAVSALAARAREGLRQAWISAHLADPNSPGSVHAWTIKKLGSFVRGRLTRADRRKVEQHLANCPACSDAAQEADNVGYRLALGILPVLLGLAGATRLAGMAAPHGTAALPGVTALHAATAPLHAVTALGARMASRLGQLFSFGAAGGETGIGGVSVGAAGMGSVAATMAAAAALTASAVMGSPQAQAQVTASEAVRGSASSARALGSATPPNVLQRDPAQNPPRVPCMLSAVEASTPAERAATTAGGTSDEVSDADGSVEPWSEQPTDEPVEQPTDEPVEQPVEEPAYESGESAADESGDVATAEPAEEPKVDQPVDAASTDPDLLPGDSAAVGPDDRPSEPVASPTPPRCDAAGSPLGAGPRLGSSPSADRLSSYGDRRPFSPDDGRLAIGVTPATPPTVQSTLSYTDDGGTSAPSRYPFTGSLAYAGLSSTAFSEEQLRELSGSLPG